MTQLSQKLTKLRERKREIVKSICFIHTFFNPEVTTIFGGSLNKAVSSTIEG